MVRTARTRPARIPRMYIARFLKPDQVRLGLVHGHLDGIDPEKSREKELARLKDEVVEELTDLFLETGAVRNRSKFLKDFRFRESQGSTAVGEGIAVPHVRSYQPKSLALIFARSRDGVWYDAPDEQPVHLFFGIAAPSYDEKDYLNFYRWVAQSFLQEDWLLPALLAAEDEHEIIGILSALQ